MSIGLLITYNFLIYSLKINQIIDIRLHGNMLLPVVSFQTVAISEDFFF
jgi:hypothetical protein